MNSAVKQYPRTLSRLLGPWATLAALLLAALPVPGQITVTADKQIKIVDATLDGTQPPPQPSIASQADPYPSSIEIKDKIGDATVLGTIQRISVVLPSLSHSYLADVDVLLVGPNGGKSILLSDVAVGMSAAGGDYEISPAGALGTFPEGGAPGAVLPPGEYKPTNFGPDESFGSGALAGPYSTDMSVFNGGNGKGVWSLYILDDRRLDEGSVGPWKLKLWYTPVISLPTIVGSSTNMNEDTELTIPVTVSDTDSPVSELNLVATSSDEFIVTNTSLTVTKPTSGNDFLLKIKPIANKNGTITLTLKANDKLSAGNPVTKTLTLVINAKNDAPSINSLKISSVTTNVIRTAQGQLSSAYVLNVDDIDSDVAGVTLSVQSGDTNIVLASDVFFDGSTGKDRTFYVAPKGAAVGKTKLTFFATDSDGAKSAGKEYDFEVTAVANRRVAANFVPVAISDTANSTNKTVVTVSDLKAPVGNVRVTLANVTHPNPEALDVWVTGPKGQKVILMSAAGGANALRGNRITFDSTVGFTTIPDDAQINTGTYNPADYRDATPQSLGSFVDTDPVGDWTITVVNRTGGAAGSIGSGVVLEVFTKPVFGAIDNLTVNEDSAAATVNFTVADVDGQVKTVTTSIDNDTLATVERSFTADGTSGSLKVTPKTNANGTTTIRLVATDNAGFSTTKSFTLTVTSVNDLPTISPVNKQITYVGRPPAPVNFTVGDVETPLADLVISARSSNTKLLPEGNIAWEGTGTDRVLKMFPVGLDSGVVDITLTVKDGNNGETSTTFRLDVLSPASPLFANQSPIIINDAQTAGVVAAATPNPSTITVKDLVGKVVKVQVNLVGLKHTSPQDLDVMLVGPKGQKVILLSDAGGNDAVQNVQLVISDDGLTSLTPSKLLSGVYKPTDLDGSDTDSFPTGPAAPVPNNLLGTFAGTDPNGTWSLYVTDDSGNGALKGNEVSGGWLLSIQTEPVLEVAATVVTTTEDKAADFSIDLGDNQPGIPTTFIVVSSNTDLIKTAKVVFSEGGDVRKVTVTPELNQYGEAKLTISAVVGGVTSNSKEVTVKVTPVNDDPTIKNLPTDKSTLAGTVLGPVSFEVSDVETTNAGDLKVEFASSDSRLPKENLLLGGSGANRTLTVLPPATTDPMTSVITVTVIDPDNGKTQKTLNYSTSRSLAYANSGVIEIRDNASGRPYPSTVNVKGVGGQVSKVYVTLRGFSHSFPDDVHVLLVSPKDDKAVILMGNAGGGAPTNSVPQGSNPALIIGFDDAAASKISADPDPFKDGEALLTSGSFKPANYGSPVLPSPAPSVTYSANLSAFNGIDPNGDWKLYVFDDTPTDSGMISDGWVLVLQTAPVIQPISPQVGTEDTVYSLLVTLSDADTPAEQLKLTAESVEKNVTTNLQFDATTTNQAVRKLIITPIADVSGTITNTIHLVVNDGTVSTSQDFLFSVAAVNDAPVITTVTNKVVINEDGSASVVFEISDVDSRLDKTNVLVSIASESQTLLPPKNVEVVSGSTDLPAGQKGSVTIKFTPAENQFGTAAIKVGISDKSILSETPLSLVVNSVNDAPTITSIPNYTGDKGVQAGGTIKDIVFQVNDVETEAKSLTVTRKARRKGSPDTLSTSIPDANLVLSQSGTNRLLTITTIGTDPEDVIVTLTVSDGDKSAETSFEVQVKQAQPVPGTVFANTTPIAIKDIGSSDASKIPVSGLRGKVYKVIVTLDGFSHTAPDDVDVLLKGPGGSPKGIRLMSDAGGRIGASNLRFEFSDTGASGTLRDDGPLASGSYVPSDFEGGVDAFPGSGITTFEKTLADAFNGIDPNGDWWLYVVDDTTGESGSIAQGWSLKIVTTPTLVFDALNSTNKLEFAEDSTASTRVVLADYDLPGGSADGYELQKRSSNENVVKADKVAVSKTINFDKLAPEVSVPVTVNPEENQYDESTNLVVTLTLVRTSDKASSSVTFTNVVRPVNDRPTLTRTTNRSTTEGVPIDLTVVISDPTEPSDNNPIKLVATTIAGSSIISSTNVWINGAPGSNSVQVGREVLIHIVPNAVSVVTPTSATIELVATDSSSTGPANQSSIPSDGFGRFVVTVNPKNDAPSIDAIADKTAVAGATISFNIKVNDPDDNGGIKVTAKSRDETLVKDVVVSPETGGTGDRVVTATAQLAVTGKTVIDLTVTDGKGGTATQTANVSVTPSRERRYEGKVIKINDLSVADPYPSIIGVDDLVGNVSRVRVELIGFSHGYPDDVDMVLVSPKGTKVVLMSDAGGSTAVTNLSLTFKNPIVTEPAVDPISDLGPLTSGTVRPANWDIANDPFSGGPSAPFETDLGKFAGESAKGEWKLYVVDDTRQDAGEIKGWALYITTQPRLEGFPTDVVTIKEDESFEIPFSITEESFASLDFKFGFASTNGNVINPADLKGAQIKDGNFVITGKPVLNASGASEVTVSATNAFNQVATGKFRIAVTAVNDEPFITQVTDVTISSGEATTPVPFDYGDVEDPKRELALDITSSNTSLIPTSNILQIGNTLVIAPVGVGVGESDITIKVTDKGGLSAKTTFKVTVVRALQAQYASTESITLRDNSTAAPYPSSLEIVGLKGKVSKVTVTVSQLNHPYPADLDILLVAPDGTNKVVLMSDAGGGRRLENARLTFDDGTTNTPSVPYNPPSAVASGTYKPSNYEGTGDSFPSPAPAGPYTYELKSLAGIDPNGVWSLYIVDDVSPDSGSIAGGWVLNVFTTEPVISVIGDKHTPETVPLTVNFQVSDADTDLSKLVATASTDRPSLLTVGAVTGTGKDRSVVVTPVGFQNGTSAVTIELSDGSSTVAQTFNVTVDAVNQAPSITGLADKSTPSNRPLPVPFVVADNETAASNLVVSASIERPSFGAVEVADGGANRVLTFRPTGEQGSTRISVVVSDGELSTTNSFEVTIAEPYALTISPISDANVNENGSKIVPFVVSGSDSGNVSVSVTIADSTVVQKVDLVGSGSAWSATVFAVPGANGSSKVTLLATDEFGTGTATFTVNIVPLDDPPSISPIADVTTFVNINANVRTTIADPDTALTDLIFTWGSSNPTLVKTVLFSLVEPNTLVATIIPNRDQLGEASVTLFAADATSKIGRPLLFKVVAVPNEPPVLGKVTDRSTDVNTRVIVDIPVTDPDTAIADLTFTATVSNPSVLRPIAFSNDGTSVKALINPITDASGLSAVTITVNDGKNTVSTSFAVAVVPAEPPAIDKPTVVHNSDGSSTITVTWSNGGELEVSDSPTGPWIKTGNSSGSYTAPVTGSGKFFRVSRKS